VSVSLRLIESVHPSAAQPCDRRAQREGRNGPSPFHPPILCFHMIPKYIPEWLKVRASCEYRPSAHTTVRQGDS